MTKPTTILNKIYKHPVIIILFSTISILFSTGLVKELISKPLFNFLFSNEDYVKICTVFIGCMVMTGTYYLLRKYYEKIPFTEFAFSDAPKELSLGLLIGICSMGSVVGLLYLMGFYKFIELQSIQHFLPTVFFIFGAAILEEIIFRGLVYRIIEDWKGPVLALFVSAIIFQIPHFINSHTGILPALLGVLFGFVVALMYMDTRRLWLPIGFHFAWNIILPISGTILSGIDDFTSLSKAELQGPEIFIGSEFGIETSIFSFLMLMLIGVYFFLKLKRKHFFKS